MRCAAAVPFLVLLVACSGGSDREADADTGTDTLHDTAADTAGEPVGDTVEDTSAEPDAAEDPVPDTVADTALDSSADTGTDTGTDTGMDTGMDTGTDAPVDVPTDSPCSDPCYVGGVYVTGCTAMCGGFAGTPCPAVTLTCVYASGSDAGICIPTANLVCSTTPECTCFPPASICTTSTWTCSGGECRVACS